MMQLFGVVFSARPSVLILLDVALLCAATHWLASVRKLHHTWLRWRCSDVVAMVFTIVLHAVSGNLLRQLLKQRRHHQL